MNTFCRVTMMVIMGLGLWACGPAELEDTDPAARGTGKLGKADTSQSGGPVVSFGKDFHDVTTSADLETGDTVRVVYDDLRLYKIVDSESSIGFFSSKYHCYGYGCCEVEFPTIHAHYRFSDNEGWKHAQLDGKGGCDIQLSQHAKKLELWFDSPGYSIKTWYCGCAEKCRKEQYDKSQASWHKHQAYDSKYAKNYTFPVKKRAQQPTIVFDKTFGAATPSSPIMRGQSVRVQYARGRFYSIINSQLDIGYFSSKYHCYGYGCCEVKFPTVGVHYRYSAGGPWQQGTLDSKDGLDIQVPVNAQKLEVYFNVPGYSIRTWYCGCAAKCSKEQYDKSKPSWREHQAWDSRFSKNFTFPVNG